MGVTLYHFPVSGPSRGALLAAKALGIEVDVQIINLFAKEQLADSFIKVGFEKQLLRLAFLNKQLNNITDQSTAHCTDFSRRRFCFMGQPCYWFISGQHVRKR